jgi:hypothetical protein
MAVQSHIKDSAVPDKIRRKQESSKDRPSMARYLQEPPGVIERIALNSEAPLEQTRTHDQQQFVAEDELMKELICLAKGTSKARPSP